MKKTPDAARLNPGGRKSTRAVSTALLIAVILFTGTFLYRNFGKVIPIVANSNFYFLVLSFFLHAVFVIFQGILGVTVLRATGGIVSYSKALPVLCLSLLGRYVPGKIWVVTSRVAFLTNLGVRTTHVIAATIKEHIYTVFSGILIALVFMPAGIIENHSTYVWGFIILAGVFLIPPDLALRTINRGLALAGKEPLKTLGTRGASLLFILLYLINWFVLGLGLIFLAMSLYPKIPVSLALPWTGLYALAVTAGFIAVFAPGGIGVREGIFFLGFSLHLPAVEAGILVLMTRVVITCAEILVLLLVLTIGKVFPVTKNPFSRTTFHDSLIPETSKRIEND